MVERLLRSERLSYAAYPDLDIYEKKMAEIFEERKIALIDLRQVISNLEVETLSLTHLAKFERRLLRERASLTPPSGSTRHRVSIKLVAIDANALSSGEYFSTPVVNSVMLWI